MIRRIGLFTAVLLCLTALTASAAWIDPNLEQKMAAAKVGETVRALVYLHDQVDLEAVVSEVTTQTRSLQRRHDEVVTRLMDMADDTQADLLARLQGAKAVGRIKRVRSFWIANMVAIQARPGVIRQLARRPDVKSIYLDIPVELIEPMAAGKDAPASKGVENGISLTGAPDLWALGINGAGALACDQDTGADGTHPAFASRWRGLDAGVAPSEAWFDPNRGESFPTDAWDHGTHTLGTMVGSAGANQIGMAPGAKWIGAKTIDQQGGSFLSDTIAGFQWAVDPDGNPGTTDDVPDVINNSWGQATGYWSGYCHADWNTAIEAAEAAGIVVVFAAGNEGPYGESLRSPANQILSSLTVFAVGAIEQNGTSIASFSSRGPSDCDGSTIKPEVVAVGDEVRSARPGNRYRTYSGTSMAAPHVSGAVLLLRDAFPNATPEEIKYALYITATDLGSAGEDNKFGRGRIDVLDAYDYLGGTAPPADYCLKMDELDDRFWLNWDAGRGVFVGYSDQGVPGNVGYPVYFKLFLLLGGWAFYLDFDDQYWPPDCQDGDYGLVTGSGNDGTLKRYYDCVLYGPDTVHLRLCDDAAFAKTLPGF